MYLEEFPISCVRLGDTLYPSCLAVLPNPPKVLYYRGSLERISFKNCLGIVGSRNISYYGTAVLKHIFPSLSTSHLSTVSGFSRGVDYTAHALSVESGIPTVAVLPFGLEVRPSGATTSLYKDILAFGGAVVSEYPHNESPKDWMYIKRNRLVAGLCSLLLVVEARERSGSLITYEYARKYNKRVATIPADMFRENSWGVCHLLKQGALTVTSGHDINKFFGVDSQEINAGLFVDVTPEEEKVIQCLQNTPSDMSKLSQTIKIPVSQLGMFVMKLQFKGLIRDVGGIFYASKS